MSRADAQAKADGSALCRTCGLCCDGSLFDRMVIVPAESPCAAAAGLRVFERDGTLFASQPCSYLTGGACTIYAERFATCRSFRCKLLSAVEGGVLGAGDANRHVAEARRLLHAAKAAAATLGAASLSHEFRVQVASWRALTDPTARREAAAVHLAIVTLSHFLNRHFYKGSAKAKAEAVASGRKEPLPKTPAQD